MSWHNQRGEQVHEHKLRVPKDAAVSDLIAALQNVEPEAAKAKGIRLMETLNSKIYKVGLACYFLLGTLHSCTSLHCAADVSVRQEGSSTVQNRD